MQTIPLLATPKQSFSVVLNGTLYDVALLATAGVMAMNLTRAGVDIVKGQRCVAGQMCLPFQSLEDGQGNFLFITLNDELPFYDQFGLTQTLLFASEAELAAVRAVKPTVYITQPSVGTAAGVATVAGVS